MRRFLKIISGLLLVGCLMWSIGLSSLMLIIPVTRAASATAQLNGCGSGNTQPCFWIPPNGQVVPASSAPVPLFSFKLMKSGGGTAFSNIKVNLVDNGAGHTVLASDVAAIAVYKRTSWGPGYTFPAADRIGTQTTINAFNGSGISANNTISITQDGTKNALTTDFMSAEYLVAASTGAGWTGGDQISYTLPADWVTVSDGTLGVAFTGQQISDNYYATAPAGFTGEMMAVQNIQYISPAEIDVSFTTDLKETSSETVTNYNVGGTNPATATLNGTRMVRLNFTGTTPTVTVTANTTQLVIKGPSGVQSMSGNTMPMDVTMMVMGGGGPGGGLPISISEAMIGTTGNGLNEFVELFNTSPGSIDIGAMGLKLWAVYVNASSTLTHTKVADLTGSIPGYKHYLIAPTQYAGITPAADGTYDAAGIDAQNGALKPNSGIYINNSATSNIGVIDRLGWGNATGELSDGPAKCSSGDPASCTVGNDGKSLERKANHSSTATTMNTGGVDVSYGNSYQSHNNQFDFIQRLTAEPQSISSPAETPGGAGFGGANNPPFINHEPLFMAPATIDLVAIAEFMDDSGQLATANTKLYYRYHDNDGNSSNGIVPEATWNPVTGTQTSTGSNFYRFTVPSATLNANKDLDYFLQANDGTNYACLPLAPGTFCDPVTHLLPSGAAGFYVNISAAGGSGVISGTVKDASGNGISGAMVFLEGMPYVATTNGSGAFTISGLIDGIYTVKAKGGTYTVNSVSQNYLDGWIDGIYINSNNLTSSGNIITLVTGAVESYGGTAADQMSPVVRWSAPTDQMMGFSLDRDITVVFDRAMQTSTITGGATTTDNIYLLDKNAAVVPGTVTYYPENSGRPAGAPPDQYLMLFNPSGNLLPNNSYTLVLRDTILGANGKRLMGNRQAGGHSVFFTTIFDTAGGQFGSGANFPPFVTGTSPGGGGFNTPLNTKININFSEAMSAASITTTNITMAVVTNPFSPTEVETAFTNYTVSLNTAGNIATLTPGASLTASKHYRVKVLGQCQSAKGIKMAESGNADRFRMEFETGTVTDSQAPTVKGTYPSDGATNVSSNLPAVDIGFSESMDASTINASSIQLKRGTTVVAATVEYDVGERAAHLLPVLAFRPGASYTIEVVSGSSGVKDVAGNALAANFTASFTTDSTADIVAPGVEFANCDDFSCAITYSEPMTSVRADDTTNFGSSVLNISNYAVKAGPVSTTNWNGGAGVHSANLGNVNVEYDQMNNTIKLMGVTGMAANEDFRVVVTGVKDKAGNAIDTNRNSFRGPVKSSMTTGGMMGPGGPGPMMGPQSMTGGAGGGQAMGGSAGFNFGNNWEKPTNVMPMNMMAGQTTTYFVEFPATLAIPAGGSIKLTFPTGSDVSTAMMVPEAQSMTNKDINGPATGTVKIGGTETSGGASNDGVSVNATARTITATLDVGQSASQAGDMIRLDLKGIKNPTVPKSFDTNGYTVDIKTFNVAGTLLDSMTSFPFFINEGGAFTLQGTITATGATTGTATIFLGSPMTGPQETTINFGTLGNGTASYSFTSLPAGDYNLNTGPSISLGGLDYSGYMKPDPMFVNGNTCTNSVCTKNFSFTKQDTSAAYELTVKITGDFRTASGISATDRSIDVFAGGPNGNTLKTVTLGDANYTAASPYSANLYLTSAGEWFVGMGPAMPKGTMMMGPPPMPAWMPPAHVNVKVAGTYGAATWTETSGTTNNDGIISLAVSSASQQIIGYVVNNSGTVIANVDVEAHSTQGGFGMPAHGQTDSAGKFTLKVTTGIYEVNAWTPGMPWTPGKVVDVRANSSNVDGNLSADVYKNNGTFLVIDATAGYGPETNAGGEVTELVLKLDKSSTTISGKLLDDTNNPVANAPVWAYNQSTGENRPSGTDSSGNYTLYVNDGNWNLGAFIPGMGDVAYANNPVSVAGSSRSDINIRSSVTNLATISGSVTISGSGVSNASVWVDGLDVGSRQYHNNTNTNSSGAYRLRVPGGTSFVLHAWTPQYGELDPVTLGTVTAGGTYTGGTNYTDFTITSSAMHTLTINFTNYNLMSANTEAFVDVFDPATRNGNHTRIADLKTTSSTTINVKTGSAYEIHSFIPGLGGMEPTCANSTNITCTDNANGPDTWAISGNASVTIALPNVGSLYTFTVTVSDGTNNLGESFVWLGSESSGFHNGTPTNASGTATLKVPAGTYRLGADKPGFTSPSPTLVVTGTDAACVTNICTKTVTLTANPYSLSGYVYVDTNSNGVYNAGTDTVVSNAQVWADKITSATDFAFAGGWTGAKTGSDGSFQLSISNGVWMLRAMSDGYEDSKYKVSGTVTPITISGASQSSKNISLTARTGYTVKEPKSSPVTPANGGTVDDTANTGVKLTIPPSALGTDTSAATISVQETNSVPKTATGVPLGDEGITLTATNGSGQAITSFSGSVNMEIDYSDIISNLPTGVSESELKLAYYDDTSNQWVEVPSSQDLTNNTLAGDTTHFTTYSIILPADTTAPSTPGTPAVSTSSSSSVAITWTAATDTGWGVAGYEVLRSTNGSTFTTISGSGVGPNDTGTWNASKVVAANSYTDSTVSAGTTYYYQVVAWDNASPNHNHSASSGTLTAAISAAGVGSVYTPPPTSPSPTPTAVLEDEKEDQTVVPEETSSNTGDTLTSDRGSQISRIKTEAQTIITAKINDILTAVSAKRDLAREQEIAKTTVAKVIGPLTPLPEVRYALINFVTYGTPETLKLGAGERAGVADSFKAAFGKLPGTAADWEDVMKIGVGRWPSQTSADKEAEAIKAFTKIYKRAPDRTNPHDDAAIVVITYGLRPGSRNLASEAAATVTFRNIYKRTPGSAADWDIMRAITYSGAKR